jgi:hypothetical protein
MSGLCSEHDKCIAEISEDIKIIKDALLGSMHEEGWLSRIRDLEKRVSIIVKIAIGGALLFLTQLTTFVYGLITGSIKII